MSKETAGLEFHQLADQQYLIEVTCTLGAYQGFQVYMYLDERQSPPVAKLLTFLTYESEDDNKLEKKETEELWGLPEFNPGTKELTIVNKFRGPGDCGTLATYGFREGAPELRDLRAKLTCDGKGAENPQSWEKIDILNSAFLLYRMATQEPYRLCWKTGERNLLLISVGAGAAPTIGAAVSASGSNLLTNLAGLPGNLMYGAQVDQDINCRTVGHCTYGAVLDRELADLTGINAAAKSVLLDERAFE
jgi:hypothetical protein